MGTSPAVSHFVPEETKHDLMDSSLNLLKLLRAQSKAITLLFLSYIWSNYK